MNLPEGGPRNGIGNCGVVYLAVATHTSFSESYAVKCLVDPQPGQGGRQRQILIREITLHKLASSHPTLYRVVEDFNHT